MPESSSTTSSAPHRKPGRLVGWFKRHRASLGLLLGGAAVLVVLGLTLRPAAKDVQPPERKPESVTVETIQPVSLPDTLVLAGDIEPETVVDVASETSARVAGYAGRKDRYNPNTFEITHGPKTAGVLDEGDRVVAGQPLVYLNSDLEQADYNQVLARANFQEAELRRLKALRAKGVATAMELDQIQQEHLVAQAVLRSAAARLERCTIVSPCDGVINALPADIGEYVTPSKVVAQIVETDRVKVVVDIPERDIHYFAKGQGVDIQPRQMGAKSVRGEITYISEMADDASRKTRTEVTIANPRNARGQRQFRSGNIVDVRLTRRQLDDVIMIPFRAILPLEHGHVVYVVDADGRAQRREIEIDRRLIRGDKILIPSGLAPGDRLIVRGHQYVGPGQAVSIVEETAEPASAVTALRKKRAASSSAPTTPKPPHDRGSDL